MERKCDIRFLECMVSEIKLTDTRFGGFTLEYT